MRAIFIAFIAICLLSSGIYAFDQINISFSRPQNAPYFLGQPEMNIDAEEFNTVILRIKSARSGTARLFWATNFDPRMNDPKSLWFFLNKSAGFKEYVFNINSQNPSWAGFVGQLLVYPDGGPEGIEVGSVQAIPGDLITNIRSGWREFWGPKGRVVIGSTINITSSSSIFGRPINIYIYWIIGLCSLMAFFIYLYKTQINSKKGSQIDITATLAKTTSFTFFIALSFWALLALNSNYNYFNIFKDNFSKYFGKNIEEKRAVAYGRDYYDFLVWAKAKLPKQPVKFGISSSIYAPELQARIYLVPHILTDIKDKDLQYLLIFQPPPDYKIDSSNYALFAKLRENAFILKRIK